MSEASGEGSTAPVSDGRNAQRVLVRGLEVWSRVGVPDQEREESQRLLVDVEVVPVTPFEALGDDIERAVDYDALARRVVELAGEGERRLIETLASDIAGLVLEDDEVRRVTVRIRKFILPQTEFVGVELTRSSGKAADE